MNKFIRKKIGIKFKVITGILVVAPKITRDEGVDFLLIGEDGLEYKLRGNKKTFQMWGLVDSRVEVKGVVSAVKGNSCYMKAIAFKCLDGFVDNDSFLVNEVEFDVSRFDYAI